MKIKTSVDVLAKFIAAAVWADGEFQEAERVVCVEIADALEVDSADFVNRVETLAGTIANNSEEELNTFLIDAAVDVEDADAPVFFECALQIVLADGVVCHEEVTNLLALADALGVETEDAVLMLCNMVKTEEDVTVEL